MRNRTEITCACGCGLKRMVLVCDVNRGRGRFYNNSHASSYRNKQAAIKRNGAGYKPKEVKVKFNQGDSFSKIMLAI